MCALVLNLYVCVSCILHVSKRQCFVCPLKMQASILFCLTVRSSSMFTHRLCHRVSLLRHVGCPSSTKSNTSKTATVVPLFLCHTETEIQMMGGLIDNFWVWRIRIGSKDGVTIILFCHSNCTSAAFIWAQWFLGVPNGANESSASFTGWIKLGQLASCWLIAMVMALK